MTEPCDYTQSTQSLSLNDHTPPNHRLLQEDVVIRTLWNKHHTSGHRDEGFFLIALKTINNHIDVKLMTYFNP